VLFSTPTWRLSLWPPRVWRTAERLKYVKHKLVTTLLVVAALIVTTLATVTTTTRPAKAANGPGTRWPIDGYGPDEAHDNVILKWDERLLETIRMVPPKTTGPTVTARAIGVLHTATYDAWAAYDGSAVGTRLLGDLRQPESQRTGQLGLDNKNKAISYAAYRVLVDLFPSRASDFSDYMQRPVAQGGLGYSPISASTDTTTPEGVGNVAADAVLKYRRGDPANPTDYGDGSNQRGNDPNGTGVPYSDPTPLSDPDRYHSVNTWQTVTDRWHWQPLCVPLVPYGTTCTNAVQSPLTPQWRYVYSFTLNPETHYPDQFQLPGPPKLSNGTYDPKDVDTALSQTSNLTDTQKAKAEYWADGGGTEFPPGHMAVFAQALSRMRHNTLDQDVKLFFALGNALMDASISAWQSKYEYDFVRPITAIRERYKGKMITSWLGPEKGGYGKVPGQEWRPYQETNVVTPPFPEYVSGHSSFSGAGGVVLGYAFGTNGAFDARVTIPANSSKIEPGVPAKPVVLYWKTLDAASDEAGWSRRWGGIHFQTGDEHGRGLGKMIGYNVWKKAQRYFSGDPTATPT
jgi:hypothetical protein